MQSPPQAPPARRVRIGMLTPSSNSVLEPVTQAMVAGLAEVSLHFQRFRVTAIALTERALGQFDESNLLRAAELLADARVDVIAWNGTSSGWLGFAADERLCARITAATGAPATSAMLALNELLRLGRIGGIGFVTPYRDDVQARIVANYAALGNPCRAERHLGIEENFTFSEVDEETIRAMARAVAAARPEAILAICTNLRAAPLAATLEAELGIPFYDSVAAALWKSLLLAGVDAARVTGWGSLFGAAAD